MPSVSASRRHGALEYDNAQALADPCTLPGCTATRRVHQRRESNIRRLIASALPNHGRWPSRSFRKGLECLCDAGHTERQASSAHLPAVAALPRIDNDVHLFCSPLLPSHVTDGASPCGGETPAAPSLLWRLAHRASFMILHASSSEAETRYC